MIHFSSTRLAITLGQTGVEKELKGLLSQMVLTQWAKVCRTVKTGYRQCIKRTSYSRLGKTKNLQNGLIVLSIKKWMIVCRDNDIDL